MKVFGFFLLILGVSSTVFAQSADSLTASSHYFSAFLIRGQIMLGSEDVRGGYGLSYGYGRPEPKFRAGQIPAQLVYEGYLNHTQSPGVDPLPGDATYATGGLAYSRWRWPLDKHGNGVYVDLGWGFQYASHPTVDLDTRWNSTPIFGVGGAFRSGDQEFLIGLRYLHISNGGTDRPNFGDNQILLTLGIRY